MQPLITIDFEASCLPRHGRSFPIEVGIAQLNGWSRSWLIRPDAQWEGWSWTAEAETLHGLTRDQLKRDGQTASDVIAELNAAVRGYRVISDNDLDQRWLATLAEAAGVPAGFRIGHIAELLDLHPPTAEGIREAFVRADLVAPTRHQARADAIWLASVADSLIYPKAPADRPLFAWNLS